tara:strand:+ start:2683 stop:2991 length:309 start_codon:yes stop_codon:yes gene_type:complete
VGKVLFPLCAKHRKELNRSYNDFSIETCGECVKEKETVDHPDHYNKGIEVIDFIESWEMDFNTGNAIKYISRHKYKGKPLEDLNKAKWYVERLIQKLQENHK